MICLCVPYLLTALITLPLYHIPTTLLAFWLDTFNFRFSFGVSVGHFYRLYWTALLLLHALASNLVFLS